jgi:streptomycin 6-kinase
MSAEAFEAAMRELIPRWAGFWPGSDVDELAADVRVRLAAAVRAWGLSEVRTLGGGHVALVCAATRAARPVVVKVSPRGHAGDDELAGQADALAFWRSTGAVAEVLDCGDDGFTVLMERLRPGDPLDAAGLTRDEVLTVLARLAARLHAAGPPPQSFPHIGAYAASWRRALAGHASLLAELDALLAPAPDDVLIHADLHGGNALRHGETWKAIDPHGVRADRHADVWALLDPLAPELPADPAGAARAARAAVAGYARAAGMDAGRARAWTRLRAHAEALTLDAAGAATSAEDAAWARRLHRMAAALA